MGTTEGYKNFILIVCFIALFTIGMVKINKKDKQRVIDLPEEWPIAKQGDTLKIYKVNADTIFIGFYNSDNRNDRIYK